MSVTPEGSTFGRVTDAREGRIVQLSIKVAFSERHE
jgi:hypothetical protein